MTDKKPTKYESGSTPYADWLLLYRQKSEASKQGLEFAELTPTVIPCAPYGESELERWKLGVPDKPRYSVRTIFFVLAALWLIIFSIEIVSASGRLHQTGIPAVAGGSIIYALPILLYKYFVGKMRKTSAIIVDNEEIHFVWTAQDEYFKGHYFDLQNIKRFALVPNHSDIRKSKIRIEEHKLSEKRPFEFDLQLFANRDRWKLMKTAIEKSGYAIEVDPLINEFLQPQEKDPAYTELWLAVLGTAPGAESLLPLSPSMTLKDNQYTIKSQIGRGGQGTAYEATDLNENTSKNNNSSTVVLKESVLPRHAGRLVTNESIRRFEQEAQMLKRIDHPNIVKLKDYFIEDSRAYLVLEHISGKSLKDLIRLEGPMSDQSVIKLAKSMISILTHLHEVVGVVHQDFTPENMIFSGDGTVKLIDFTSARKIDDEDKSDDSIAGKLAYMSPEQFKGEIDVGSDLYALGGTLYFLLTGEEPEALSECDVSRLKPDIEPQLAQIVSSLTVQDKAARCRRLNEVIDLLEIAQNSLVFGAGNESTKIDSIKIDLSSIKEETIKVLRPTDV